MQNDKAFLQTIIGLDVRNKYQYLGLKLDMDEFSGIYGAHFL